MKTLPQCLCIGDYVLLQGGESRVVDVVPCVEHRQCFEGQVTRDDIGLTAWLHLHAKTPLQVVDTVEGRRAAYLDAQDRPMQRGLQLVALTSVSLMGELEL